MKVLRLALQLGVVVMLATAFVLVSADPAEAQFHARGALVCSQCHTMHDRENATPDTPLPRLLLQSPITDLCLSCHNGTAAAPYDATPDVFNVGAEPELSAGDFNYVAGVAVANGHDCGGASIGTDATYLNSPGGNFLSANLACTSCHDPHGTGGATSFAYRNLYKTVNAVDVSAAILSDNLDEATLLAGNLNVAPGNANHNVYQGSFGAWCAACHSNPDNAGTGFHGANNADIDVGNGVNWIRHPTDTVLTAAYVANYNAVSQYDYRYPVIENGGGWTVATQANVTVNDRVFCLSCHKAHASQFANALRWDMAVASGVQTNCSRCHDK